VPDPTTTDPDTPPAGWSRRRFIAAGATTLLAGGGAAVLGSLAGCTGSSGPATPVTSGPDSSPSPPLSSAADRAAFVSAHAAELQILDLVTKTVRRHPSMRNRLHDAGLVAAVHVHVLAQAILTSSATGTPSSSPSTRPVLIPPVKVPNDPTRAVFVVADFLDRAADARLADSAASAADAAALLASLAASDASLAAGLRRLP
jgi:hypothetical protein